MTQALGRGDIRFVNYAKVWMDVWVFSFIQFKN